MPSLTAPTLADDGSTWLYPDSWSATDRETWEAIQGRTIAERRRLADVEGERARKASEPSTLLAAARLVADQVTREREVLERRALGEQVLVAAQAKYGDRMATFEGEEGDRFILLPLSTLESTASDKRAERLAKAAGADSDRAEMERDGAYQDSILDKLISPPRERAKDLLGRYALLWPRLYLERDKLLIGVRAAEGKGSAP